MNESSPVYRVISRADWIEAQRSGAVPLCGADARDGFIHLSTADTMLETANLYFQPDEEPLILEIATSALGDALRWEVVAHRSGQSFPHLYAPHIPTRAVLQVYPLRVSSKGFCLGDPLS